MKNIRRYVLNWNRRVHKVLVNSRAILTLPQGAFMSQNLQRLFEAGKKLLDKILDTEIPFTTDSVGIKTDSEQKKQENEKYTEIAEQTIVAAKSSGYFKQEALSIISEKIRENTRPGYGYIEPFDKADCLTLEEKKTLGLNTRRKYARELINALTEKGLAVENPNDLLKNMWLASFHKISRKYELQHLKDMGLKYVQILDCNDERDCKAVKRCKKRWLIDEVPELPLPHCDAEYCRCSYVADESELLRN